MTTNWLRQAVAEGNAAMRQEGAEQERSRIVAILQRELEEWADLDDREGAAVEGALMGILVLIEQKP